MPVLPRSAEARIVHERELARRRILAVWRCSGTG
jgi:hypothetical protein